MPVMRPAVGLYALLTSCRLKAHMYVEVVQGLWSQKTRRTRRDSFVSAGGLPLANLQRVRIRGIRVALCASHDPDAYASWRQSECRLSFANARGQGGLTPSHYFKPYKEAPSPRASTCGDPLWQSRDVE